MNTQPGLYGIINSNRDFSNKKSWGKNEFNSSFPLALSFYMDDTKRFPVYITVDNNFNINHKYITVNQAFGYPDNFTNEDIFISFESISGIDKFFNGKGSGNSSRSDIAIFNKNKTKSYHGMEVKLTAIPDNATHKRNRENQSGELVIRPVSIVHLSNTIALSYKDNKKKLSYLLKPIINKFNKQEKWLRVDLIYDNLSNIFNVFHNILKDTINDQRPVLMQTIWRTVGKSPRLSKDSMDTFFWSGHALAKLFLDSINIEKILKNRPHKLERKTRSLIWVMRMLIEYSIHGNIPGESLIHELSYGNQTDKAFASSGNITIKFLKSDELITPRVKSNEINKIIKGSGIDYLSPERRLDASLYFESKIRNNDN